MNNQKLAVSIYNKNAKKWLNQGAPNLINVYALVAETMLFEHGIVYDAKTVQRDISTVRNIAPHLLKVNPASFTTFNKPMYQRVADLRLQGLSNKQIAQRLNRPVQSIRVHLNAAIVAGYVKREVRFTR